MADKATGASKIAGAKKRSLKGKGPYAIYKNEGRASKNRVARLQRHLKTHPYDEQAIAALKASSGFTGRKQPLRNRPQFVRVVDGTLTKLSDNGEKKMVNLVLTTLDNRISRVGKEYIKTLSEVKHFNNVLATNKDMLFKIGTEE